MEAIAAVVGILFVARKLLPWSLQKVAETGIGDLVSIGSLVAAFGTAGLAAMIGLSLPLGAFLAGIALSGSRYAHQVFSDVAPLRDAFGAVFFTSIGMLLDPAVIAEHPLSLIGMWRR